VTDYDQLVEAITNRPEFKRRSIQPPTVFYVTLDDVLELDFWSVDAAVTVQLSVRMMGRDGQVIPRFETNTKQTTGTTPQQITLKNVEGYLLSASVITPSALRGSVFVSLKIRRGLGSGDSTAGEILLQGYPGSTGGISYPRSPIASPLDGRGLMRSIALANPAAGIEFSQAVPAGVNWILRSVKGVLTASGAAANRVARLKIADGAANVLILSSADLAEVATLAFTYNWFNGAVASLAGPTVQAGIPGDLRLLPTWTIGSVTTAIDAADQWSAVTMCVEEFIAG
jgi:hypothetical protein